MNILLLHEHYTEAHLADVINEMRALGAPTIKAVWMECHGAWAALEGCHRIRAAHALGLTPEIDEIEYSDAPLSSIGIDQIDHDYTISEVCDGSHDSVMIKFED